MLPPVEVPGMLLNQRHPDGVSLISKDFADATRPVVAQTKLLRRHADGTPVAVETQSQRLSDGRFVPVGSAISEPFADIDETQKALLTGKLDFVPANVTQDQLVKGSMNALSRQGFEVESVEPGSSMLLNNTYEWQAGEGEGVQHQRKMFSITPDGTCYAATSQADASDGQGDWYQNQAPTQFHRDRATPNFKKVMNGEIAPEIIDAGNAAVRRQVDASRPELDY